MGSMGHSHFNCHIFKIAPILQEPEGFRVKLKGLPPSLFGPDPLLLKDMHNLRKIERLG